MSRRVKLVDALCAVVIMAGCRVNRPANNHAITQTLYDSTNSDPGTFNPILLTDSASSAAISPFTEGLVKDNPKTTLIEPDLAASWVFTDDGKTLTLHLRRGIKWSDGAPFTSHDVIFTFKVIYDHNTPNLYIASMLVEGKPIKLEAPDDYTVVMRLPRPFAPLLHSIEVPIIPAHVLEPRFNAGKFNRSWGVDTPPGKLVALGAYQMQSYVPGQLLSFKRNPDYWMHDSNGGQLPRLLAQVTLIVSDQNAQYLRFLSGLTDIYSPRPEEVFSLTENARKLGIIVQKIGIDTGSLFFAFNRNPRHYIHNGVTDPRYKWFTDINFMRALAHTVDKQGMINLCFRGLGVPAISDVSPANQIYWNSKLKDYDYDLKLAARLLDEAGYKLIRPGVRADPEGHPLVFDLTTNTGVNVRDQMCTIFKQDLESLGIKVNYRPLEFISLVKRLDSSFDWDCVLIGFGGGIEPNDGADFLSSAGNLHLWNPSQPKPATPWEAEIDQLLDQGTRVIEPERRAPYYWRIQEILHEQLPIIETVRQLRYVAYRNSLENYDATVWGLYQPELIQFRAN